MIYSKNYYGGTRAAAILVSVSVPAYFDGIGIGQVHYTSTNSVKYFFQSYQAKIMMKKLTMTANSIVFPCIGAGICTCEYI